ncbi:3-isopropylmalate dehydratase large subunit [Paenibacillus alvei]|uniref:3-isopropylmalate dehydratase large subunit n=1 Tax=Paenibacillus alvei TaxID=44250 RepID=UPI00227DC2C4|nr:3-isopropylmalate dehydratase large subunit [Paenibacillus alvei]
MGLTAIEKIISNHAGKQVHAGDLVIASVDAVMAQDGNAPLAIKILKEELGASQTFDHKKVILVIDHCGPSPNEGASNLQQMMRDFSKEYGATLYDAGEGISHVLLPEQGHAQPGKLIVGSDSHSVTYGAVNCFGTGMGSTDIATAMYTGKVWMRVPETIKVALTGRLPDSVSAKDLALHLVRLIGVSGATYKCVEISGDGLTTLNMDNRFTICNMAIEMGAKCTLMPVDDICRQYLEERNDEVPDMVWSDPDCSYDGIFEVDLSKIEPLVALPHDLTKIVSIRSTIEQNINMAFIGTCTNSRISDLEEAANVLRSHKINPGVRLIITPGSRSTYLEAVRKGYVDVFITAGAIVTPPGCGPCVGTHLGIPGDSDVVISTANRNFKGRMGNPQSSIILASPATVAASAILGKVGSAEEVSRELTRQSS